MVRKGTGTGTLLSALLNHKHAHVGRKVFYTDCINICLVVAGLRPGCRLDCRDWEVDTIIGILGTCQINPRFRVSSPWLNNINPQGHIVVFFNHAEVRPVDIQTIRDENTDDSPQALAAYRRVLGYPCVITSSKYTRRDFFRASVVTILKHTTTAALHSVQLFACACPISRYKASMKYMEQFALKATRIMSATRLGEYVVQGFACCDV